VLKGFKEFILRGNVIDLAVAVVIGAAFTAIVNSLVESVFNPIIGAIFNANDLKGALVVTIPTVSGGSAKILFGAVIAAAIQFLIVAAVVYFALVLPINRLSKIAFLRQKQQPTATPAEVPPTETELLIEIRDLLAQRPSPEGDHTLGRHSGATEQTTPSAPDAGPGPSGVSS
jgi:large conductance mechanosensitive channel